MSSPTETTETGAAGRRRDLARIADRWLAAGLSTAPADRPRAAAAVRALYRIWQLPAPEIVWCGSPRRIVALAFRKPPGRASGLAVPGLDTAALDRRRAPVINTWRQKYAAPTSCWFEPDLWHEADTVRSTVEDRVWSRVGRLVETAVVPARLADTWQYYRPALLGPCDASLMALCEALVTALDTARNSASRHPALAHLAALSASAGWALALNGVCYIAERAISVRTDELGRLDCADGPALIYPDGFGVHALAGVAVPARMVAVPHGIVPDDIDRETNAELRRVMLERFGYARFLAATGATLVDEDETGRLWMRRRAQDDVWAVVEVVNGTPEPDGRHRHYFLRVPPTCRSAREAVAWTYGLAATDYAPTART